MPTVKLTVPAQGLIQGKSHVKVEAIGYSGEACIAGTDKILKDLGKIIHDEPTDDMYKQPDTVVELNG